MNKSESAKFRGLGVNVILRETMTFISRSVQLVFQKGFPLNEELGKIQEFLDRFGETEHIYMRRDAEKKFKGSVFATYTDVAMAKKFIKEEALKYGENEVVKMLKEDYFLKKAEERKQKREEDKQKKLE